MTWIDGFVSPVPEARRADYAEKVAGSSSITARSRSSKTGARMCRMAK